MSPITRSAGKPKSEEVVEQKLPKPTKSKKQAKKPAEKKINETEKTDDENLEVENGDAQEILEKESKDDGEMAEKALPKSSKRKIDNKKPAKTTKTTKSTSKKQKVENDETNENPLPAIEEVAENTEDTAETIYKFTVKDIDGNEVSLEKYKGHVCIIVNVASRCGHTKSNYEQFVELYNKYGDSKGLRILAFPCNQFGSQESGTCEKIKAFVEKKGVTFDMFDKIDVNGKNACPLWTFLKEKLPEVTSGKATGKDIKWNFTKFLINKDGVPVERYPSSTKPLTLLESLEKLW